MEIGSGVEKNKEVDVAAMRSARRYSEQAAADAAALAAKTEGGE